MTSMASRADVEAAIWRICGRAKWQEVERLLALIDGYAVTMAHKIQPTIEWHPDPWKDLRPGQTQDGMRRCMECGKVKKLESFARDQRCPLGRRMRCKECRPPRRHNTHGYAKVSDYMCVGCSKRLPIEEFPEGKKRNPSGTYKCFTCRPEGIGT